MALTNKQRAFITEYLKDFNATQAAIRAGYSERSAADIGHENLRKPKISAVVEERMAEAAMSSAEVLYHLTAIARGDIGDVLDFTGGLDMTAAREKGVTAIIRKVKHRTIIGEDNEIHEGDVEMYDRLRALEILAKYHDLINKVKIEDWRSELLDDIKAQRVNYEDVAGLFDH